MDIAITEVLTKKDLNTFIHLPANIHKNHPNWAPPLYIDERAFFNPKKNNAFAYSDTILLLARKDNKAVGRIMGIINHQYNKAYGLKEARFVFLETYDDIEVAHKLIGYVEEWAKAKKADKLVGPLGFSDKDPQGLLIEGFEHTPVIATNYNFEYIVNFVTSAGFTKKVDLVVYKLDVPQDIPEFYAKINERALRNNPDLRIVKFKNKLRIKPYIKPVFKLVNETYKDIYAFTPMSDKEIDKLAGSYLPVLNPRYVVIIEKEEKEVVAFILAIPDFNDGIKKSHGRIFPFGIIKILRAQKKTRQLNLFLGAIREDYRNAGLDAILGTEIFKAAKEDGFEFIDSHLELETNTKMRAENEKLGATIYKRYRIFEKDI